VLQQSDGSQSWNYRCEVGMMCLESLCQLTICGEDVIELDAK
jgi:hypothetical protein